MKAKFSIKRYLLYLVRWQLSTPLLAICLIWLSSLREIWATVISNFIGGMLFFFIDRIIFKSDKLNASWQIKEEIPCIDCGKIARGYRLVKDINYDKTNDKYPEFRCEECSKKKYKELKEEGLVK